MPEYTCLLHTKGMQLPIGGTCKVGTLNDAMNCCDQKMKDMIAKSQQIHDDIFVTPWNQDSTTLPDAYLEVRPTQCETMVRAYDYTTFAQYLKKNRV